MSCSRASTIDVESYLLDPAAAEFEAFREHFVGCSDCARAVARWAAFDAALLDAFATDGASRAAHPAPERLEAHLASGRAARAGLDREAQAIERHLSICPSCRTEMEVLEGYDPELLWSAVEASAALGEHPPAAEGEGGFVDWVRGLAGALLPGAGVRGAALPALAMAALAVVAIWWGGVFDGGERRGHDSAPQLAVDESPLRPEATGDVGRDRLAEELAQGASPPESRGPSEREPTGGPSGDAGESVERLARAPEAKSAAQTAPPVDSPHRTAPADPGYGPVGLAAAEPTPPAASDREVGPRDEATTSPARAVEVAADSSSTSEAAPLAAVEAPREEILLAEVSNLPAPSYDAPPGAELLGWTREFGAVRSGAVGATIETRAPADHAGLALSTSPRLWWSLSERVEHAVEVTISDDRAIDPVLRVTLLGPHESGLHAFDLADHGVTLEPGIDYRWFVSLIVDRERPSRNPVAAGALRVVGPSDERRETLAQTVASERGHTLARLGIWYDAYDFFATLSKAHPESSLLVRYRDRLGEHAGVRR